jgi:hypothetical protein
MCLSIAASRALWYVSPRLKGRLSDLELDILNEGCRFKSPPLHANTESAAEKTSDGMSLFRCVSTLPCGRTFNDFHTCIDEVQRISFHSKHRTSEDKTRENDVGNLGKLSFATRDVHLKATNPSPGASSPATPEQLLFLAARRLA